MNQTLVSYLSQYEFYDILLKLFGNNAGLLAFVIYTIVALIIIGFAATVGGLGTYAERKISADIQARIGPNRVGPYGILQFLADGVKMITKEDVMPFTADKFLFYLAPMLCLVGVFATLAVLPWSNGFMMADLNVGIFYLIAISSLVGVGVFLGGYASNSKWSMLGGMRGASQIISYEIPVTISILAITLLAGGMGFGTILSHQVGSPLNWFIFHNPFSFIAFFVYFTGALAETNRAPFDLPEAESELVSGYHTEYTGMRFGFFALAEYIEVFVVCGVGSALFLGGGNLPFDIHFDIIPLQLAQVAIFITKALLLYYVVIWVRWTFPRLRVDQLMSICWKYLTPIAIFNLIGSAVWLVVFNGKSMADLLMGGGH
jgi:NADH-quinone oxidoreductase subunit H